MAAGTDDDDDDDDARWRNLLSSASKSAKSESRMLSRVARLSISASLSTHRHTHRLRAHERNFAPLPTPKIAQVGKTDVRNYTYHAMSFIYLLSSPFELRKECSREVIRGHINN